MNRHEVMLIRSGLLYLVATAALGVAFLLQPAWAAYLRTTHLHLGVLGFFLQMVMGVAYWMMPRPGGLRQPGAAAATFWLLNAGILLRTAGEPWWRAGGSEAAQAVAVAGGVLQLAAVVVFAAAMSRRVRTATEIQRLRGVAAPATPGTAPRSGDGPTGS